MYIHQNDSLCKEWKNYADDSHQIRTANKKPLLYRSLQNSNILKFEKSIAFSMQCLFEPLRFFLIKWLQYYLTGSEITRNASFSTVLSSVEHVCAYEIWVVAVFRQQALLQTCNGHIHVYTCIQLTFTVCPHMYVHTVIPGYTQTEKLKLSLCQHVCTDSKGSLSMGEKFVFNYCIENNTLVIV